MAMDATYLAAMNARDGRQEVVDIPMTGPLFDAFFS